MLTQPFRIPSHDSIQDLLDGEDGPRVSLYVPVPARPGFDDVRDFPGSYGRLTSRIAKRMEELGIESVLRDERMRELGGVDVELSSLHPAVRSIAVFAGPRGVASYSLVDPVPRSFHVGRTFRLRPLLKAARKERSFRVVSLSTKRVELFEGDARSLRRIEPKAVPRSLEEALGSELTSATLQLHSSASRGAAAIFHGHGGAGRDRNLDKDRFHRVLAGALRQEWGGLDSPIVLVADRAHEGRFRKTADLPGLLEEGIAANPGEMSLEELHARALSVVQEASDRVDREALAEARAESARGRGPADLASAALAAVSGRVDRLFVASGPRVDEHIDPTDGSLHPAFGDEDALDELCGLVLAKGGSAVVVDDGVPTTPGFLVELRGS